MSYDFLNFHVLFTTSVANPNRDDTGTPKQVTYGGATRSRISSQAMTRAKRVRFELNTGGDQLTFRAKTGTADQGGLVAMAMAHARDHAIQVNAPLTPDEDSQIAALLTQSIDALVKSQKPKDNKSGKGRGSKAAPQESPDDPEDSGGSEPADAKKDTLIWLAEPELRRAALDALTSIRGGSADVTLVTGNSTSTAGRTGSIAIAAFGRMFAARPDLQNEAAIQRSHAFTTHPADIEPDYFTAVNDLPRSDDGRGAGHLAINQLTGGVYYWHFNIDRRQLWNTWIPDADPVTTRRRLVDLLQALLIALPTGKQTTTAYKTLPDAVLTVEATVPVALHQAFEQPVTITSSQTGYRGPSLKALVDTQKRLIDFTPVLFNTPQVATTLDDVELPAEIRSQTSLDALIETAVDWIIAGQPKDGTR